MKPIYITEDDIKQIKEEFEKEISRIRLFDGEFKFTRSWKYDSKDIPKTKLYYTPSAYLKMIKLVNTFDKEVAWHGLTRRMNENTYLVYDIIIYDQIVTSVHVDTDDEKYTQFLCDIDKSGKFDDLRFQGHSHVNMGTSPSSTDLLTQKNFMQNMKDGFYVFTIWNKKGEHTDYIYDYDNNIMYDSKDIVCDVLFDNDEGTMTEFVTEAKTHVEEYKSETKPTYTWTPAKASEKKSKKNEEKGKSFEDFTYGSKNGYTGYIDGEYYYNGYSHSGYPYDV